MEFFDDAVNKTKEVFDVVSKKTGDAINIGKLKYEIASLESKKEKDYALLGRMYYELIRNGTEPHQDMASVIKSIKEKDEKIEELNGFLSDKKSVMICSKCGAQVDADSIYCNICGEKLK